MRIIFLALIYVYIPLVLFFSPLAVLIASLLFTNKTLLILVATVLFIIIDVPILFFLYRTVQFRNDVKAGKYLFKLVESKTYHELLQDNPSIVLAIPERLCDKECQLNLEKVKEQIKYVLVPSNDPDKILAIHKGGSSGGRIVDCHQNGQRYYDPILVSAEDANGSSDMFTRPCKPGFMCMMNFQIREPFPEVLEHLSALFGVRKNFPN